MKKVFFFFLILIPCFSMAQKDSLRISAGFTLTATGNTYKGSEDYYSKYPVLRNRNVKTLKAGFVISLNGVQINIGSTFFCKDRVYLFTDLLKLDLFSDNFNINKIGFLGINSGIKIPLLKKERRLNPFIFFDFDYISFKMHENKIKAISQNTELTGSATWQYEITQYLSGFGAKYRIIKKCYLNLSAGISKNSHVFYNSDKKYSWLSNLEPIKHSSIGFNTAISISYNFFQKK